jgi:hypothetical protein
MHEKFPVSKDAFSSGQISSKIWLCEQLERSIDFPKPPTVWIYGGWHGITAFLLLARGNMHIGKIRSFDIDPECQPTADILMENWLWKGWAFKAFTADCNAIDPTDGHYGDPPDIVINSSTEHFTSRDWYHRIPKGTAVVLQSNNMPHDDHHDCYEDLGSFVSDYDLDPLLYSGQLDFEYPTWSFSRYMQIGVKPV